MKLLEPLFAMDTSQANLRFRPQSLSAPARLATVGAEAAETMYFHPSGKEMTARKSPDCQPTYPVHRSGPPEASISEKPVFALRTARLESRRLFVSPGDAPYRPGSGDDRGRIAAGCGRPGPRGRRRTNRFFLTNAVSNVIIQTGLDRGRVNGPRPEAVAGMIWPPSGRGGGRGFFDMGRQGFSDRITKGVLTG